MKKENYAAIPFCAVLCLLLTVFCMLTCSAEEGDGATKTVNVKDCGAVGDGVTDDTLAINLASYLLEDGDTLYFPAGTYLVREHGDISIILINDVKDVQIILDDQAVIQMEALADDVLPKGNRHFIFHLRYCENVTFTGGAIYGERLRYQGDDRVDQGYGIRVSDGRNVTIRDVEIAHVRGDGIWLFSDTLVDEENFVCGQSYDVTIDNCHIYDCFRNGITLTSVVGCVISNTEIHGIRGGDPQAAVDIEAEFPQSFNRDVTIVGCNFYDNGKLSVALARPSKNISIISSNLEQQFAQDDEGDGLLLSDCTAGMVCIAGKNTVIENCSIYQLRMYDSQVTCKDTVFDGLPSSSRGLKEDLIPFRLLVTDNDGMAVGRFENCTFRGRRLCALGGCMVYMHAQPAEMEFIDCQFQSCGLIPFVGKLGTVERTNCFFSLSWGLWLCLIAVASLVTVLIVRRSRKRLWVVR